MAKDGTRTQLGQSEVTVEIDHGIFARACRGTGSWENSSQIFIFNFDCHCPHTTRRYVIFAVFLGSRIRHAKATTRHLSFSFKQYREKSDDIRRATRLRLASQRVPHRLRCALVYLFASGFLLGTPSMLIQRARSDRQPPAGSRHLPRYKYHYYNHNHPLTFLHSTLPAPADWRTTIPSDLTFNCYHL
jgi:hypothetical protein